MAVLSVLVYPDERLKQVSAPVVEFNAALQRFIADLEETMLSFPGCVGLAAPQVSRFQRIVIVDVSSKPGVPNNGHLILINPEIVDKAGEAIGREGCLSVPDYTGNVARADHIHLQAQDASGQMRRYDCEGYEARAVQHEIDHLDGFLFLDRLVNRRDLFRRKVYQ
jgi:peptide deformylase